MDLLTSLGDLYGHEEKLKMSDLSVSREGGRRKKILIVDDEPRNIRLLEGMLAGDGGQLLSAGNGKEAVEKALSEYPDVILLDILMPEMNGFEATRILKKDPRSKNIPIILVTALDGPENRISGLEAGAEDFLNKPVSAVELATAMTSG